MNVEELGDEYQNVGYGWQRAAFGSIIRRHYNTIKNMTSDEKKQLIRSIGAPDSYMSELYKEMKGKEYDLGLLP